MEHPALVLRPATDIDPAPLAASLTAPLAAALCPLSGAPMLDPVATADGHSYERAALAARLAAGDATSPLTGLPLRVLGGRDLLHPVAPRAQGSGRMQLS